MFMEIDMSNMPTRMRKAAAALTAVTALTVLTPTPALAWGHTPGDKARNAAVVIGGLAVAVAAVRGFRRRGQTPQQQRNTLG